MAMGSNAKFSTSELTQNSRRESGVWNNSPCVSPMSCISSSSAAAFLRTPDVAFSCDDAMAGNKGRNPRTNANRRVGKPRGFLEAKAPPSEVMLDSQLTRTYLAIASSRIIKSESACMPL